MPFWPLTSGGGSTSPLTTKGDVWGYSTKDARIPVGADGQVLTARSSASLGVDWEALPAAPVTNEVQAGVLVNATSVGDAGGRADHFTGSSLAAQWTVTAGTPVVKYSSVGGTAGATNGFVMTCPYTPTGAFRIETRVMCAGDTGTNQPYIKVQGPSTNYIYAIYKPNFPRMEIVTHGFAGDTDDTFSMTGGTSNGTFVGVWLYLYLARDGSNNITAGISLDRVHWFNCTGGTACAGTLTKIAVEMTNGGATWEWGLCDFIDVVS